MQHRYIVIEGAIGSGKGALAKQLAEHFGAQLLSEQHEGNPFLERFYENAAHNGLATELQFLLNRIDAVDIINTLEEHDRILVADFLLEKDHIFVPVILNGMGTRNEQTLYWDIKRRLLPAYPVPDLLIYLQSHEDNPAKRLGSKYLAGFPDGYVQQIQQEYDRFFHLYENAPLLMVNTDSVDFSNEEHFQMLLDAIANMKGKRAYMNLNE